MQGEIILVNSNYIVGWVKNDIDDAPVKVSVLVNDKVKHQRLANQYLKEQSESLRIKIGKNAFRIDRELLGIKKKSKVRIVDEESGYEITEKNSPLILGPINRKNRMNLEKRKINTPNIFLVGGEPGAGKSTFAEAYKKKFPNTFIYTLDNLFKDEMYPEKSSHSIFGFVNSAMFNPIDYLRLFLKDYIQKIDFNKYTDIILDGYVLTIPRIRNRIKNILGLYGTVSYVTVADFEIRSNNKNYPIKKDLSNLESVVNAFYENYKSAQLKELTPITKYQFYDDLGQAKKNSNSKEKFELAELPELKNLNVLDIGSNAGYITINIAKKGAKKAIGIDLRRQSTYVASRYNSVFYKLDSVSFYHIDIFAFHPEFKLDVIYMSSVFHYFQEKQALFVDLAKGLLVKNGLLVIEVELYEDDNSKEIVHKLKRSVDNSECYFPNQLAFSKMIEGKFKEKSKKLSTAQKGTKFNRYFFHLISE